MMNIEVFVEDGCYMPEKAHDTDAGFDLRTPNRVFITPGNNAAIDTGVHMMIPEGYVGFLKSKSGLNIKSGITGEGVIDAGYTGSIVVKLQNDSVTTKSFEKGDKIIQIVILPIPEVTLVRVDQITMTSERGDNGFGSSGR